MDNKITIDVTELLQAEDNSVTDAETIRQIALLGDNRLFSKIKRGYEVAGLYPHIVTSYNIKPEELFGDVE